MSIGWEWRSLVNLYQNNMQESIFPRVITTMDSTFIHIGDLPIPIPIPTHQWGLLLPTYYYSMFTKGSDLQTLFYKDININEKVTNKMLQLLCVSFELWRAIFVGQYVLHLTYGKTDQQWQEFWFPYQSKFCNTDWQDELLTNYPLLLSLRCFFKLFVEAQFQLRSQKRHEKCN